MLSGKFLEVKNLKKNYNDQRILDNITLSINAYDIYALVGKNGSGKTTLLSILSGLIQADEGIILMDKKGFNKNLTSISFQPASLYPYLSGKDNIELLSLRPFKAFELLNRFNQSHKILNKKVKNLSFGQKQLLGLAISLSKDAQLYLLDEPTNGLDIDSYKELINIIKETSEKGKTFIISTHKWDVIEDCCNRIGLLFNGTIQKEFNSSELFNPIVKMKTVSPLEIDQLESIQDIIDCKKIDYQTWHLTISTEQSIHSVLQLLLKQNVLVQEWLIVNPILEWERIYNQLVREEGNSGSIQKRIVETH